MSLKESRLRSQQGTDQTAATLSQAMRLMGLSGSLTVCERIEEMAKSEDPFTLYIAGLAQVGLQRITEEAFPEFEEQP